jgi:hypothetical protein
VDRRSEASIESRIGRREVRGLPTSRDMKSRYTKERTEPLDRGDCGPSI